MFFSVLFVAFKSSFTVWGLKQIFAVTLFNSVMMNVCSLWITSRSEHTDVMSRWTQHNISVPNHTISKPNEENLSRSLALSLHVDACTSVSGRLCFKWLKSAKFNTFISNTLKTSCLLLVLCETLRWKTWQLSHDLKSGVFNSSWLCLKLKSLFDVFMQFKSVNVFTVWGLWLMKKSKWVSIFSFYVLFRHQWT